MTSDDGKARIPHERSADDRRLDRQRDAFVLLCTIGAVVITAAIWFYGQVAG